MELTTQQIDFIRNEVLKRGITFSDLADSLTDHICCSIENNNSNDFDSAFANAFGSFGSDGLNKIQDDTIKLLTFKKTILMKKTMNILGYVAAFLSTTGLLFKLQHWPGAAIMLTLGIALLNFGFLPMYFYDRYKTSRKLAA